MQCEVWSVKTLLRLSLKKKTLVEGRTRSGQVFLRTIGHLFLGNFRRRLARVLVINYNYIGLYRCVYPENGAPMCGGFFPIEGHHQIIKN